MLRTSNKVVKKEAIDVFKQIQIYMGDRLSKTSPTQAALDVVSRGWTNKDLRDEIFIQLCRQTTVNPKPSVILCYSYFCDLCLSSSSSKTMITSLHFSYKAGLCHNAEAIL